MDLSLDLPRSGFYPVLASLISHCVWVKSIIPGIKYVSLKTQRDLTFCFLPLSWSASGEGCGLGQGSYLQVRVNLRKDSELGLIAEKSSELLEKKFNYEIKIWVVEHRIYNTDVCK